MIMRKYIVYHKRGRIIVMVPESLVFSRGERSIVVERAWQKLMGLNLLGVSVDKHLETRKMLMDELKSRYRHQQAEVYETFRDTVSITWVGVEHVST